MPRTEEDDQKDEPEKKDPPDPSWVETVHVDEDEVPPGLYGDEAD